MNNSWVLHFEASKEKLESLGKQNSLKRTYSHTHTCTRTYINTSINETWIFSPIVEIDYAFRKFIICAHKATLKRSYCTVNVSENSKVWMARSFPIIPIYNINTIWSKWNFEFPRYHWTFLRKNRIAITRVSLGRQALNFRSTLSNRTSELEGSFFKYSQVLSKLMKEEKESFATYLD